MQNSAEPDRPLVLIVEDEALIRWNAEILLQQAGYATLAAANADEALLLLERHADIRVAFSDVTMPGSQDGKALAQRIRACWPCLGIVLTSGNDMGLPRGLRERATFLSKPYRADDLVDAIAGVIEACDCPSAK